MSSAVIPTAPWGFQGFAGFPASSGFQGIDPVAMDGLVRLLEQAAFALLDHRREIQLLLVEAGMSPGTARRMVEVEDWLAAATEDVRRRQTAARAADRTPPPTPPPAATAPAVTPPACTTARRLVSRTVGPVRFTTDALSGKGLSGYCVVGLAYRHLGTETRSVTSVYDDGGGWRRTVVETQRRGVFEVQPGLGWENIGLVRFRARRWYNPWAGAGTIVRSAHP